MKYRDTPRKSPEQICAILRYQAACNLLHEKIGLLARSLLVVGVVVLIIYGYFTLALPNIMFLSLIATPVVLLDGIGILLLYRSCLSRKRLCVSLGCEPGAALTDSELAQIVCQPIRPTETFKA